MFIFLFILFILCSCRVQCINVVNDKPFKLSLTISAKLSALEISWYNLPTPNTGYILLTTDEPTTPFKKYQSIVEVEPQSYSNETHDDTAKFYANTEHLTWTYGQNNKTALNWIQPIETNGWITTSTLFDYDLLRTVNKNTKCYGYWAIYINNELNPIASTCIRAYGTWMNDYRETIKHFKFRDLFIVGSHDSGSYRNISNKQKNETLVSKYLVTQSDDITSQLMHGIRYLDIRIGYYRASDPQFWVNHGVARFQPLDSVLRQVRDFVLDTNEIVIFDVQEFPVGFGKKYDIHRKLVQHIHRELNELLVNPEMTWDTKLEQIWQSKRNIIFSYDNIEVVREFPSIVFQSVQQRWGNVQSLADLKKYLAPASRTFVLFSSRPFSDMAEITPTGWDIIMDRYGGLRRIADESNRHISKWYTEEWGMSANIVSVDFYRGTNLLDGAIYWNLNKDTLRRMRK